ncbi:MULTISPECIES: RNA polymerase recycling motor HelD [unclassified Lysinibacillus]|uniref:RNA polymerase recycling motor HelD n=1 Tax=unclassified Lysinibacillus TaxID=2636778 RepID=UPI00088BB32A|nr:MULTISPECIES: RNA polymerase recycling motor HelD [unclassified Lysinibacillus]SCY69452.1 DNA helicase-2 / ATP-dependent DNA helicase PcrA [Lysinibacillus sp. SG9]SDB31527.1 DNA helicase-2 / ATP-dependent DNA helicase PcrA [Lysinibacillus sp. TC-37]SFS93237.1 DNA helicase-2 / ATP-dependent DNA helicase PcrA [Lysinibacillus sp. SG55]
MENQNDWLEEKHHLEQSLNLIDHKKNELLLKEKSFKENAVALKKTFWNDVRVNLDTAEDVDETFFAIKQQVELLSDSELAQQRAIQNVKVYERLQQSPYFARIDFLQDGQQDPLKIYIGVATLLDEQDENIVIYDWRAPISSMYYDCTPGKASYDTTAEEIHGEMLLKRQFIIKNGQLQSMFNTGLTIGDDLLLAILAQNANEHIRSIVATIQAEQNKIIRHVQSRYLIVEGVAGSGKTAVALQRVAYLLYRYRNEMTADQILLITPNQLFNQYVHTVLPDLGEDNMQQLTFIEYVEKRLGRQFKLEYPYEQLEDLLTEKDEAHYQTKLSSISYKASLAYKHLMDQYVSYLSNKGLLFKNIVFRGERIITAQEITEYFYSFPSTMSIPNRLQFVKEWVLQQLTKFEKAERTKEWVEEATELLDKEDYSKSYSELLYEGRYTENSFDDLDQERQKLARQIVKKYFKPLRNSVHQLKFVHMLGTYRQLFDLNNPITKDLQHLMPNDWEDICQQTLPNLAKRFIAYEDAAPFLYLQDKIEGQQTNTMIHHVLIDEAQDYSPFQLTVLQQLFPKARMTILGDGHQTIHPHTFDNPSLLDPQLYGEQAEKMILTKSYRSTKQIIQLTAKILNDGSEVEAFNRTGPEPSITVVPNELELIDEITQNIHHLSAKFETIAVICKTAAECSAVYGQLSNQVDIQLINHNTKQFKKGILLLPAYMAKGIEFDAVLIYNASAANYAKENERYYFYTACTRAMHELHIYSINKLTHFLQ